MYSRRLHVQPSLANLHVDIEGIPGAKMCKGPRNDISLAAATLLETT